jgi:hypothetical protein
MRPRTNHVHNTKWLDKDVFDLINTIKKNRNDVLNWLIGSCYKKAR